MSLPECGVGTAGCLAETSRRLWSWDLCAQDAQPWFPSWPPLTGQVGSPGLRANLQLNGVKPERAVPPLETAFPFGSFPRGGRGAFLAEKGPAFCCFPTFLPLPPPTPQAQEAGREVEPRRGARSWDSTLDSGAWLEDPRKRQGKARWTWGGWANRKQGTGRHEALGSGRGSSLQELHCLLLVSNHV